MDQVPRLGRQCLPTWKHLKASSGLLATVQNQSLHFGLSYLSGGERNLAGQKFVQHAAQRPHIHLGTVRSLVHFRGKVFLGAPHVFESLVLLHGLCRVVAEGQRRQAKIGNFRFVFPFPRRSFRHRAQDVVLFQVPVDNSNFMQVLHTLEDLLEMRSNQVFGVVFLLRQSGVQRPAVGQLHDVPFGKLCFVQFVQLRDVLVVHAH
mmetsp:Transcript_59247/g.104220  ORF Transcript_59247/g.104220 Transcript_59247/m.104220 type:complete len:205 (+) Transcript_59247:385-999(+)